jgi:predicted peptidase
MALLTLLGLASIGCSDHGNAPDDYLARTAISEGKNYGYRVFVPKNRDPNTKVPVMLYLHGSGARGDDNFEQIDGLRWAIEPFKDRVDFLIVLPQCRENTYWGASDMAKSAIAALDGAVAEFNGDPERLYLAGFSLGGYGAWHIAAANPGKFAALVAVAGGVVGERPIEQRDREVMLPELLRMLDSPEPYESVAAAIGQTPVWTFHGSADDSVPVEFTRKTVRALKENGNNNVRYTEYQGDGHFVFNKAFSEPGFLEWLRDQKRSQVSATTK